MLTIVVADQRTTTLLLLSNHSGMGGAANTEPADTWIMLMGTKLLGIVKTDVAVSLTGLSAIWVFLSWFSRLF